MIYFLITLYILFNLGYASGRKEEEVAFPSAFLADLFWPFWLGY
jgi:hypothetical protein